MADDPKAKAAAPAPNSSPIIRAPEANPVADAEAAINDAEARRKAQDEAARTEQLSGLPPSVLAEMEAGRAALARKTPSDKA